MMAPHASDMRQARTPHPNPPMHLPRDKPCDGNPTTRKSSQPSLSPFSPHPHSQSDSPDHHPSHRPPRLPRTRSIPVRPVQKPLSRCLSRIAFPHPLPRHFPIVPSCVSLAP
ncbi:hypothetical protein EJ06DRAFT_529397 [Trichodelitschia bisporula]|uniref:Uncharacterized protein n=1 Tax=Trichodelitschia bisporula TaxID=703511 RepID=A0A6G1HZL9_9PEZI|nr:hypothetical protein EJ06DRAFT_529397 [Trichodelitschia bisporula]